MYSEYIKERRMKQKEIKFKKEMKVRAQIEGTISEGTRFHGLRYKKYKGESGDQLQFYLTGAAINRNSAKILLILKSYRYTL